MVRSRARSDNRSMRLSFARTDFGGKFLERVFGEKLGRAGIEILGDRVQCTRGASGIGRAT